MATQPDDVRGTLAWAVHELAVAIAEADVVAAAALGVTAGDHLALKHLLAAAEPLGPVELARLLGMSSGSATTLVERLARAGHVDRRPHPSDGRRRAVTVTAATRDRMLGALRPIADAIETAGARLTTSERTATRRFLADVTASHRRAR